MPMIDQPPSDATVLTRGHVVIDTEACKGCDLCIDACPPNVLVMTKHIVNARGYRFPLLLPGCTGCKACTQICPDFVFQVYKLATPIAVPLETAATSVPAADEATPGSAGHAR